MSRPRKHDLAGKRYGRLTVIAQVASRSGQPQWRVFCACGNSKTMATQSIVRATSCGCVRASTAMRAELAETRARLRWAERLLEAVCNSPFLPPAMQSQVARAAKGVCVAE